MKNRIDQTFTRLKRLKRKCLIIYITGGDPDIRTTLDLMHSLVSAGADILEIGVPFSDPMGDGVPNQRAAERALKKNTNLKKILQCINEFRKKDPATPVVIFSYLNPVYSFGYEHFARRCRKSGVDGCLFVDMPYDEELFLQRKLRGKGVHTIFLVAPTTEKKRLSDIAGKTKGFLYAVSSLGVTGLRKNFEKGFSSYIRNIRKYCHHPLCVGFGISSPDMAKKASRYADGVIVGSAVVSRIEKNLSRKKDMKNDIMRFVRSIRKALS